MLKYILWSCSDSVTLDHVWENQLDMMLMLSYCKDLYYEIKWHN